MKWQERALARRYDYEWQADFGDERAGLLIHVIPIGMAGGKESDQLAFSKEAVDQADFAFDMAATPIETPFIRLAKSLGKKIITSGDVIVVQALEQFVLYTGVRPKAEQVRRAAEYALR